MAFTRLVCLFTLVACVAASSLPRQVKGAQSPVGECPMKDSELPTYLPDSNLCSVFYQCDGGSPVLKQCLPGLCFDKKLKICAFSPLALRDLKRTRNISKHGGEVVVPMPLTADGSCPPRDTNETIYLPDTEDCSIYYICSNGNAIKNECPPEMSWNAVAHICDWDLDANCNLGNSSDVQLVAFSAVGTCPPRDTNVTVFLTDSANCSIYYICSNGRPIQSVCPPDMSWNADAHICDWDLDANCNLGNSSDVQQEVFTAVGKCPPRDTNVTVFLTDSANCSIYYICSNGRPIPVSCSPGMAWNSDLNVCDWDLNVDCQLSIKPLSVVGTCPPIDPPLPILLPDSESCKYYYECSGGIPFKNECPGDLQFNPTLMVCDYYLDAGCKVATTESPPDTPTDSPTTAYPSTT